MLTSSACGPLFGDAGEGLPQTFFVTERAAALAETFDIESDSKKMGSVAKKIFSFTANFNFSGPSSEKIAHATEEFFSFGRVAHLFDAKDKEIGRIEEVLFTWVSPAKYRIFDCDNRLIAIARMNFWGTGFVISDPSSQKEIAIVHRPWLRFFHNSWTVEVSDSQAMDPRLLVFLSVYQIDSEARLRVRGPAEEKFLQGMHIQLCQEEPLVQELDHFDTLADDQILENWPQREKEYAEKLSSFTTTILSRLSCRSQKVKSSYMKQKEFEKQYAQMQQEHFLECLQEGICVLKDPNVSSVEKKILYNLLKEMKRERLQENRGRGI